MVPYTELEQVIRSDVNKIKNEEHKKNILRFNQLAGIIPETELDETALKTELIDGGVSEVLAMKDLYQYTRGIQDMVDLNRNNSYARFLARAYNSLSYKYRELYNKSKSIEYIVNILMEITLNANDTVDDTAYYLAYDAAKYVLKFDEYANYIEEVLTFLKTLNENVDRYILDHHKKVGFNMISASMHIIRGLNKTN